MTLWLWIYRRFMPNEGWLTFGLVLISVLIIPWAVTRAGWVPEVSIVWYSTLISFGLSYILFYQGRGSWLSWVTLSLYLWGIPLFYFVPLRALGALPNGLPATRDGLNLAWILFRTRLAAWIEAVVQAETSQETLPFAIGLALLTGLITCLFVWSVYQKGQPIIGVSLLFLGLGFNSYYSTQVLNHVMTAILSCTILMAVWEFQTREKGWETKEIDYSEEIRINNHVIATLIGVAILMLASGLPAIPYSAIARAFQNSAPVIAIERELIRVFGGVAATEPSRPSSGGGGGEEGTGSVAGPPPGIFPRAYLLGSPAELAETPLFEASLLGFRPGRSASHWRATYYDIYSGRGWRQSRGESTSLDASEELPLTMPSEQAESIRQRIIWLDRNSASLFVTIGQPQQVDRPSEMRQLAGSGELIVLQAPETDASGGYVATSQLFPIDPARLNQVDLTAIEEGELFETYTALPDNISNRTRELARQITMDSAGPYEQAQALERYLRQYSYNLNVEPPPPGREPVDYFLFELQEGYCDYYATSMVVMARSLGLPARLGVGYVIPELTADGKMIVRRDHGHSWPEIYFPGHGWVEFEPTAGFEISVSPEEFAALGLEEDFNEGPAETLDLSDTEKDQPPFRPGQLPWGRISVIFVAIIGLVVYTQRRHHPFFQPAKGYQQDYQTLVNLVERVGFQHSYSDTPSEFSANFETFIQKLPSNLLQQEVRLDTIQQVKSFIKGYEFERFGPTRLEASRIDEPTQRRWRSIQRNLRGLWLRARWQRFINSSLRRGN